MPSRRISAPDVLAPHQEIAVNAYSSYNSDNVNMLTRIVTGEKDHDFVINGLDVSGLNRIQDEILGDIIVNDSFNYADLAALNTNWITEYMDMGIGGVNKAVTKLTLNTKFARCKLKSKTTIDTEYIGDKFKIEFTIQNTPKQLHVCIGSETFSYRYPNPGSYTLYMDLISENGIFENLTFLIDIDTLDQYCDQQVYIDDITLTQVVNKGDNIAPITDPTVDPLDIPERLLHPHETAEITAGVCVKDETMINMVGTKGSDLTKPISTLIYGNNDSWIKGEAFQDSDFTGQSSFWDPSGTNIPVAYANGELENDSLDDGELNGPRKIDGDASVATVKWAYICIYYSYFKHPNPNKAYLGLAKPEELENARYGEDYLILAKLRFIDKNTVDAIFYYPERKDWGFIDATRVNYLHLTTLKHWLDRPINVSLALDQLASSIYHIKGCLYFQTQRQFTQWRNRELPTGVGHGPYDYMQRRSGSDPDNSYDLLAFVVETNTFWKSKLLTTGQIDSVAVTDQGDGYTHATVIFDGGVGSGAKLWARIVSGSIASIMVKDPGSNYVEAPAITITGGTDGAATAYIVDGKINKVVVTNGGSGYDQSTVAVTISASQHVATATATIDDGKVTEINVISGGKYISDIAPTILISGDGSGARATATMNIISDDYDPVIVWEELSTKRFEIDWSFENNGSWPASKPDTWIWYDGETTLESDVYKTLSEAQEDWPLRYYKVKGPQDLTLSTLNQTVVNPFNPKGRGLVPGPTSNEVNDAKFLRSDGTWQWPTNGVLMFDNYIEFKSWYTASDTTYTWVDSNDRIKIGRRPNFDYDTLIFVIEDNTYWRTPSNPLETGSALGSGWSGTGWTGDPIFNDVPTDIKRITNEFEIRWGASENDWAIDPEWEWVGLMLDVSGDGIGDLISFATGSTPAATLSQARNYYPARAYIYRNDDSDGGFRVVNPFNPCGNGLVPGATSEDIDEKRFLRSDGKWASISNSFRFYLAGWPQDNLWVGKIISDKEMIVRYGYYRVQNAPQGITLRFTVYHNNTAVQEFIISTSVAVDTNIAFSLTSPITVAAGDNISIKITQVGHAPNEGGNDLAIVLY